MGSIDSDERSIAARAGTPKSAGIVPATGALSNDYREPSGSVDSDERSIAARAGTPKAAGIVPATGALSNDYRGPSGSVDADERASFTRAATPLAGTVPVRGWLRDDCYKSTVTFDSAGQTLFACFCPT
ncbi:MAG UNVERIFIED_CONTAM: hypothetical protein LVR18_38010 [Planctomycetaceae bacterium]